jgi:CHAD domain-containing protein
LRVGSTYREAERKFEVDATFRMPPLTDLPGVASVDGPSVVELEAVYYDSADLRLARRKITLRRRVGGEDEGWHLKLPVSADVRDEIRRPLTAGEAAVGGDPEVGPGAGAGGTAANGPLGPVADEDAAADDVLVADDVPVADGDGVPAADVPAADVPAADGADVAAPDGGDVADSGGPTKAGDAPDDHGIADDAAAGARVPDDLLDLVQAYLRGAAVRPVISLQTRRAALVLRDESGERLAEVVDDDVTSRPLDAPGKAMRWREVEVELIQGDRRILAQVGDALLGAGAAQARSASKAARALGPALEGRGGAPTTGSDDIGSADPAGPAIGVIKSYLAKNVAALLKADPRVRLDEPDAVHKMRVAARRLRSTLRTFQPLFDPARASALDGELRDLAAALSGARDNEVLIEHFDAEIAALPPELVSGPVAETVHEHLRADGSRARDQVVHTLRDKRYLRLLVDLDDLLASPAPPGPARAKAAKTLAKLVRHADRRLSSKIDRVRAAEPGPERDEAYHSARKQAKRLRYAAEAVTPLWGREAAAFAGLAADVQEVLGTRQDAAVARGLLQRWGVEEQAAGGPSGFTLGVLLGREECRATAAERDFDPLWAEVSRRYHRRWLAT